MVYTSSSDPLSQKSRVELLLQARQFSLGSEAVLKGFQVAVDDQGAV
jgi:hypothetical protein